MAVDPLATEFLDAGPGGAIEARYDLQLEVMLFESARAHSWPFGTTLDGVLTLDLDTDRILAHAELMWPRSRWKRKRCSLPPAEPSKFVMRLPNLSTDTLVSPPEVSPMLDGTTLVLAIGSGTGDRLISLGDTVGALVSGRSLVGFVVTGM